MSIEKVNANKVIPAKSVVRKVVERTKRIEIITELNKAYYANVFREWVEYENDVPVKITTLPILRMTVGPQHVDLVTTLASTIDAFAEAEHTAGRWPKDDNNQLMTINP